MIEVKNITKMFMSGEERLFAVNDVSFTISNGEFVTITGRSGSGKSTLMYQMSLLDRPSGGEVLIDGIRTRDLDEEARTKMRLNDLGYVFQDYALIPELSALENVMIPLLMQGHPKEKAREMATLSLKRAELEDRMEHYPSELSGGQQQRVSIARAIAHNPKIIFADEPTANLDTESSKLVLQNFLELNKEGQTILMVTHEPEYAAMAHRIITMGDGKVVSDVRQK
jgi:putative ABC transport system ATP-binding protein